MKIAFFELEEWEKSIAQKELAGNDIIFFDEPLTDSFEGDLTGVEVVSVFIYSKINEKTLKKAPDVKLVNTSSTGFDHIDVEECARRGIAVTNVPRYGENTVAEHTFALILAISRQIVTSVDRAKTGDFDLEGLRGFDLKGKTIGVIGTGRIGSHVVRMANGFEMNILAYDPYPNDTITKQFGAKYVSLEELLQSSDIITLHVPCTPETTHIINANNIHLIKRGAYLINTARGALVDTEAIVDALNEGILAGAGIDVFEEESDIKEERQLLSKNFTKDRLLLNIANNILLRDPRVIATPHNAFNSKEALERILNTTIENIQGYSKGEPVNTIKPKVPTAV